MTDVIRQARDAVALYYMASASKDIVLGQYFIGWCNYLVWAREEGGQNPKVNLLGYKRYARDVKRVILPFLRVQSPAEADPVFTALAQAYDGVQSR